MLLSFRDQTCLLSSVEFLCFVWRNDAGTLRNSVYFGLEPGCPAIFNSYIILVTILTTCLFRQNRFNIYFNYHSDADECLNNSHNCSENANCTNTEGSFNCSCKPGYIGNGHNCSGWFLAFLGIEVNYKKLLLALFIIISFSYSVIIYLLIKI